jgi:hypothetical protein
MTLAEINTALEAIANVANPSGTVRFGNLSDVQNQSRQLPWIIISQTQTTSEALFGNVIRYVYNFQVYILLSDHVGKSNDGSDGGKGRGNRQMIIEKADAIRTAFIMELSLGLPNYVLFQPGPTTQVSLQGNVSLTGYQFNMSVTSIDQRC